MVGGRGVSVFGWQTKGGCVWPDWSGGDSKPPTTASYSPVLYLSSEITSLVWIFIFLWENCLSRGAAVEQLSVFVTVSICLKPEEGLDDLT